MSVKAERVCFEPPGCSDCIPDFAACCFKDSWEGPNAPSGAKYVYQEALTPSM